MGTEIISSAWSKYIASTKNRKNLIGSKYKVGYWGEQTLTAIANVQTAKAVQDQFNFGSGAYNADLKLWEMEQNIDVWQQLQTNINTKDKWLNKIYNDNVNKKNFDKEIPFEWYKQDEKDKTNYFPNPMGFGQTTHKNFQTLSWPFGRVGAICKGKMWISSDNSYFISGSLSFVSDKYSWKEDGDNKDHNRAIKILGGCYNWFDEYNGKGEWELTVTANSLILGYQYKKGDVIMTKPPLHINSTQFGSYKMAGAGSTYWKTPSSNYKDGEMPVNYSRKFYFYLYVPKK